MPWVISNGKNYLNKNSIGALTPTKDASKAERFEDQSLAERFRRNLPKSLRNLNYVTMFVAADHDDENSALKMKVETAAPVMKTTDDLNIDPAILELDTFVDNISGFQKFLELTTRQRSVLEEGIKRVEAEIMDIEHAIEFSNCDVVRGYRWYKMLQEARQRRRTYKDAIMRIDILLEFNPANIADANIVPRIKGMANRAYAPRALPHLFAEDGTPVC